MGWLFVGLASISEVAGAIGLKKYSQGKTVPRGILFMGGFAASFLLLYFSFSYIPISIAYTVWIGVGTAGAVIISMLLFGEARNRWRVLSLLLIIIGVVGLSAY